MCSVFAHISISTMACALHPHHLGPAEAGTDALVVSGTLSTSRCGIKIAMALAKASAFMRNWAWLGHIR